MTAIDPLVTDRQSTEGMVEHQDSKGRFVKGNKANPIGANGIHSKA